MDGSGRIRPRNTFWYLLWMFESLAGAALAFCFFLDFCCWVCCSVAAVVDGDWGIFWVLHFCMVLDERLHFYVTLLVLLLCVLLIKEGNHFSLCFFCTF